MHQKSIKLLNKALGDELSAVHQYMYFHFHLDDMGYKPLSSQMKRIAIEEMTHAEDLAERILFLGGDAEMKVADPTKKILEVAGMLECAMKMEQQSAEDYNRWAQECAKNADSGSKKIFEALVESEERHFDIFQTQLERVQKFGERYLALQSFDASEGAGEAGD
ncbi:bacterioferritin [Candidatus Sumerlaeota bacterium]|nr:bacterioferritin [Candidatus Sumerlaeota bacterium]